MNTMQKNPINDYINELHLSAQRIHDKSYIPTPVVKIREIERKVANSAFHMPTNPIDLKKLFKKAQDIFLHNTGTFSNRDLRNLILVYHLTFERIDFSKFFIAHIDFSKKTTFRKAVMMYLHHYTQNESMELLRGVLTAELKEDKKKAALVPCLVNAPYILQINGHKEFASHFINGIEPYLRQIMFPSWAFQSQYIYVAIFSFFSSFNIPVKNKLNVVQEISKNESYKFLIPKIAEDLILSVYQKGTDADKNQTVQLLHAQIGDPRRSSGQEYKWNSVSAEAKRIYLSWLKRADLQLFFDVISRTADDTMWPYRRTFWEGYLDKMYYTRVVLTPLAAQIAHKLADRKDLDYATLSSSVRYQSLFMFSIGDYTFIEASHNGKLRIWRNGDCPIPFYDDSEIRPTYSYTEVIYSYRCIESFVHSSPQTYSWQNNVSAWIRRNIPNI